jgi:hypothetical protein
VKEAVARGAKARTSAKYDGQIYYPTILTDVPLDAAIANEETFGPVVVVEVVDSPDEAIAAANRTMHGLTSSILAGNTYKAFEMAPKVLAGIVNVNSPTVNDEIHAPMGGVRDSGWGRTGPLRLDDFSDVVWINSHTCTVAPMSRAYSLRPSAGVLTSTGNWPDATTRLSIESLISADLTLPSRATHWPSSSPVESRARLICRAGGTAPSPGMVLSSTIGANSPGPVTPSMSSSEPGWIAPVNRTWPFVST